MVVKLHRPSVVVTDDPASVVSCSGRLPSPGLRRRLSDGSASFRKQVRLFCYHELPDWCKGNEYILSHYRADWPLTRTILSVFEVHNETLNIWTHLLGFILFAWLTYSALVEVPGIAASSPTLSAGTNIPPQQMEHLPHNLSSDSLAFMPGPIAQPSVPRWPLFVFLWGAMVCLLTSASCHWFSCHSATTNYLVWKLDYLAIVGLVCTSFIFPVYYAFMCDPLWRNIYLLAIGLLGISTGVISLSPKFNQPTYQSLRAGVFSLMALSGIVPCFHKAAFLHPEPIAYMTTACELTMGLVYLVGAVVYASKVPEKWLPGRFDIVGHSHQILHVLVVVGALIHYNTAWTYLTWREQSAC